MTRLPNIIKRCMECRLNVILLGRHGVGKTQMVFDAAKELGLVLKYYSAPTLDPWADLVGIPVPVDDSDAGHASPRKHLQFVRPLDIEAARIIFFDELNRAHPKVLNAVLEMIQFKTINGVPLPNLEMVWAAINPAGDVYQVADLDPALWDRFHVHLNVPANPSIVYLRDRAGIPHKVAQALVNWWTFDLNDDLRRMISPRRLEYMGKIFVAGIDLQHTLPPSVKVPLLSLLKRLDGQLLLPFELTREALVGRQDEIVAEMKTNADVMLAVRERLEHWADVVPSCVRLFLALSSENQVAILKNKAVKVALLNLARQGRNTDGDLRQLADRMRGIGLLA